MTDVISFAVRILVLGTITGLCESLLADDAVGKTARLAIGICFLAAILKT